MSATLLEALRAARACLHAASPAGPVEIAIARAMTRDLDDAVGRLEGALVTSDLTAIMCHDLRDPLASIVMGASFLGKTLPPSEGPAQRVVAAIARSAQRMGGVIDDFHDLAKLERGTLPLEVEDTEIAPTLQAAVASVEGEALKRSVAICLDGASAALRASFDRKLLSKVLAKLLDNAVRFTGAGGEVVVRAEAATSWVRVSVRDTGRGIPDERIAEIFDHVANAKRRPRDGPGLGLAIARGLVELQGGAIGVESQLGSGSLFWFTLPGREAGRASPVAV